MPIIKPPAASDTAARTNAYQNQRASRISSGSETLRQNATGLANLPHNASSVTALQNVQHLSGQQLMSPASQVIATINANPHSHSFQTTDCTPIPSPYQVSQPQYHYNWQTLEHETAYAADMSEIGNSHFSPHQYYGQPQNFATTFDQVTMWDGVQSGTYDAFRSTVQVPYPNSSGTAAQHTP